MDAEDPYRIPVGVSFPTRHEWPVVLRSGGVVLRPLRWTDRSRWRQVRERNQDWLEPWEPTSPPDCEQPPAGFGGLLRSMKAQVRAGTTLPWVIGWDPQQRHADRTAPLVGQVTMSQLTLGSARQASLGYWVDHEFAGRGITPTAVALVCDYAFAVMRLHRIEVCIVPENRRSIRVVEKLGLRREGTRPDYLHIAGAWRDHEVFAIHEDEASDGLLLRLQRRGLDARDDPEGAEI